MKRIGYTMDALKLVNFINRYMSIGEWSSFKGNAKTLRAVARCEYLGDIEVNRETNQFKRIR